VVLLPWPQDYFQACSKTTLCRSKCSAVWNAFDAALSAAQSTSTVSRITVQAESLFFPTLSVDAFMPMRIWAMIQPRGETCLTVCGRAVFGCVAVAGVKEGKAAVQYCCLPVMVTSAVYRTLSTALEWQVEGSEQWVEQWVSLTQLQWQVEGSEQWVDSLTQLHFADSDGQFLVALASMGKVFMASRAATVHPCSNRKKALQPGVVRGLPPAGPLQETPWRRASWTDTAHTQVPAHPPLYGRLHSHCSAQRH
jgi:hypothetical protein